MTIHGKYKKYKNASLFTINECTNVIDVDSNDNNDGNSCDMHRRQFCIWPLLNFLRAVLFCARYLSHLADALNFSRQCHVAASGNIKKYVHFVAKISGT